MANALRSTVLALLVLPACGESDPVAEPDAGEERTTVELRAVAGNTPTLRLEQDDSAGFAEQIWDIAANELGLFFRDRTGGAQVPFRVASGAPTDTFVVTAGGAVGIGTPEPAGAVHVRGPSDGPQLVLEDTNTTAAQRHLLYLTNNGGTGLSIENRSSGQRWVIDNAASVFRVTLAGTGVSELQLDPSGNLTVVGSLVTGAGGTCDPGPCDGTFASPYQVESLAEHAAYMWSRRHLWGVGPTPEGEPIDVSKKLTGMLHELEKAHIYIEELDRKLTAKQAEVDALSERLRKLEAHVQELSR